MTQNKAVSENSVSDTKTEMPEPVQCREGVSVLYKGHYLYSKYAPDKLINSIISNITVNQDTLVLIFSPVLWLGLENLILKLNENCKIAAIEYDDLLFNFAEQNLPQKYENQILFFNKSTLNEYSSFIQNEHFKRVLRIDFSAGTAFFKSEYDSLFLLTQSVIDQFWKNRLTLIKFGRLYSKNIFKNLCRFENSIPFESLYNSVEKPILVCGAGESLDKTITQIKNKKDRFFILAVDAAANSLLENGITPDAIVAVEAQLAIEKAYIGKPAGSKILLFCDCVSRPRVPKIVNGNTVFFISEYAKMNFFRRLEKAKILPPVIKPLGSVGLVAVEIALRLRKSENTKIIFSGLDFSYSTGITHSKGTPAHKHQLMNVSRLCSVFNLDAAFGTGTFFINSKNGRKMISTKALEKYARLFTETFSDQKNLFDAGESGIDLKFQKINLENFNETSPSQSIESKSLEFLKPDFQFTQNKNTGLAILNFLEEEQKTLTILKDILINGGQSEFFDKSKTLSEQIFDFIEEREYLFIHFPDAVGKTNTQSFFNRIRIEIDFFLKEINLQIQKLRLR
ncbi:MAG: 6-hydroxymethylpterin diphosphokinase MptE-like protein [Treponema sp.]